MAMRGVGSVSAVMAMMAVVMMVVASTSAYGITRFQGSISNSWLLTTTTSVLVIDAQSSSTDGLALAAKLTSLGFSTQPTILITHGHPDHFYGLPAVMSVFPGAQVFVASQQVKDSIIADVASSGSATPSDVANFDFVDVLQISGEDFQAVGATFKVISGFLDTEAPIETVIADDQTQSLFTGDVFYVSTHLYLGPPLTTQWLENWIAAQEGLAERYATYTVYPGHGPSSSNIARVASDNTDYIHYFVSQLCAARSLTDVPNNMVAHYPTYDGAAFTSFILNNTAWATYRTQNCSSASALASPLALVALVSTIVACVLAAF